MSPTVLVGQEFITVSGVAGFVNMLNSASGSPGDWAAAAFVDGPDTDSAFFYRTSLVNLLSVVTVYSTPGSPDQPRNLMRYDISLKGYRAGEAPSLSLYSTHMKAGSQQADQDRRLMEAQRIRNDAEALPAGRSFLVGGDFNMQASTQAAFQELVGSQANNAGRFTDIINTPGDWQSSSSFRFVHTQDPYGAGGMDDRYDFLLLSSDLVDGTGFDYVGNPSVPYSTTTWNDPNHSFRSWGNDGTSYNTTLTVTGNTMVGPTIAQALRDSIGVTSPTSTGGHLPVFLDIRLRAQCDALPASIDFGDIPLNAQSIRTFEVSNSVDAALWGASAIAPLSYTLSATGGFAVPGGTLTDAAGGGANTHTVTLNPSTLGTRTGTITILPSDPRVAARTIALTANAVPTPSPVISKPADGTMVNLNGMVVTAAFPGFFYLEPAGRASGIRVEKSGHILSTGWKANVIGTIRTNLEGERYIEATSAAPAGPGSVAALGMHNRALGGGSAGYDAATGAGQQGVPYGTGHSNFGLLVRTWGRVVDVDTAAVPGWFVIDDGAGLNINVAVPSGVTPPEIGRLVSVTGPCSCVKVQGVIHPRILLRSSADVHFLED